MIYICFISTLSAFRDIDLAKTLLAGRWWQPFPSGPLQASLQWSSLPSRGPMGEIMTVNDLFMSALIMWTGSTALLIFYPGQNGLTGLNLFLQDFTGRGFFIFCYFVIFICIFLQQRNWHCCCPSRAIATALNCWKLGRGASTVASRTWFWDWTSDGSSNVELHLDLETFPSRAATTAVSTLLSSFMTFWLPSGLNGMRNKMENLSFKMMKTIFEGCRICFGKM